MCSKTAATYCLSVTLFDYFSFSTMEISVTDFSAPIDSSIFKLRVHIHVGKVYCLNEN